VSRQRRPVLVIHDKSGGGGVGVDVVSVNVSVPNKRVVALFLANLEGG
jgi:hypothetical protein